MAQIFKIECNGAFQEGRAMALVSSMVNQNIHNTDINLVSSDGIVVPANRYCRNYKTQKESQE